jgi:tetratricopeptide (TPR) repeat protein
MQDLVDITYLMPAAVRLQLLNPVLSAEEKGDYETALKLYKDMVPLLEKNNGSAAAKRHAAFKVAYNQAKLAEQQGKTDDYPAAADALIEFIKENGDSWQAVVAGKQLGQIQVARGKFDEAVTAYEQVAKLTGLPESVKQEVQLLAIDALLRGGKAAQAESQLEAALKSLPNDDPQRPRLNVYLIACKIGKGGDAKAAIKQLTDAIQASNDPTVRAVAYNALGDAYLVAKQVEDAKFAFLMVDIVLNQDKTEHAKAVERLAKLFDEANDEQRAEDYKAKLLRIR